MNLERKSYKLLKDRDIKMCFLKDSKNYREIALIVLKNNGNNLQYMPKELQTEELCLIALQQNPLSIEYVSKELLDIKEFKIKVLKLLNGK